MVNLIQSGQLAHYLTCFKRMATGSWSTYRALGYLKFWGIRFGKGCTFGGMPIIRRYPGSTITIGDKCNFLSTTSYNYIGINHPFVISTHNAEAKISIGCDCGFSGTTIGCAKKITIGNRVRCGANTIISDTDWHPGDPRTAEPVSITIEDNVWLGANATVLKGVTIGTGSVVGTGSIVTNNIPAGMVVGGVPAKIIKSLK